MTEVHIHHHYHVAPLPSPEYQVAGDPGQCRRCLGRGHKTEDCIIDPYACWGLICEGCGDGKYYK